MVNENFEPEMKEVPPSVVDPGDLPIDDINVADAYRNILAKIKKGHNSNSN